MRWWWLMLVCSLAHAEQPVATFSIVARDAETGDLGVAVQSKFFAVGAVVPYAKAGVGAIATQSYANPDYGPDGLALLAEGLAADAVVAKLTQADPMRARRQLGVVGADGRAGAFTGSGCHDWAGHLVQSNFCVQGNLLASEEVVGEMQRAFVAAKGPLPERLVAALAAGQAAGGDKRGRQSAALLVVRKNGGYGGVNDCWVDIRVDDHPKPIEELARLLKIHRTFYRP